MKRSYNLLIASALQFALLVPLARWANKHRHPPIDVRITHLLQRKSPSLARRVIKVLNRIFSSGAVLNLLAIPLAALLWSMRLRLEAVMTLATCWTSGLVRTGLKALVGRPRPNPLLVKVTKQSSGKSFPSGDVSSSVIMWGWLAALGLTCQENSMGRKLLFGLPALPVALVGPARVYLGDHWTTDVLGGYLFGGGWLSLTLSLYFLLKESDLPR
jgi:undecaprenyl-diphosphatase